MKKLLSVTLVVVMLICMVPLSSMTVFAVNSCASNFWSATYSSDPGQYMANIARAQLDRTRASLGYNDDWCAAFVSDAAIVAGQSKAIPWNGVVTGLRDALINAGAVQVYSPIAGDIVIFGTGHCGICIDTTYLIDGNNSKVTNGIVRLSQYSWFSSPRYYRPAYSGGHVHSYSTYVYNSASHPHYKCYKCSCGDVKENTSQPNFVSTCAECLESIRPSKPTLTVHNGTSTENTILTSSAATYATSYDYRIYNADTSELYTVVYGKGRYYSLNLPKGNYYASVVGVNYDIVDYGGATPWGTYSEKVYFTVSEGSFEKAGTVNYQNHKYDLYLTRLSFEDAKLKCEELGGHLATITSAEENTAVKELAGNNTVWIGATDDTEEGTWTWVSDEEFAYSNWQSGEPNNNASEYAPDSAENYLLLNGNNGYWQDSVDANYTVSGFICEYDECLHSNKAEISRTIATCSNSGKTRYFCPDCEEYFEEITPATSHTETCLMTIYPACTEGGYDIMKCTVCGARWADNATEALGHNYETIEIVPPTYVNLAVLQKPKQFPHIIQFKL